MTLHFTTAPTPPKDPVPEPSTDIIVDGKRVGMLRHTEIVGMEMYHAYFYHPDIGFCRTTETLVGHGLTPEEAIENAIHASLERYAACVRATTTLGISLGVLP